MPAAGASVCQALSGSQASIAHASQVMVACAILTPCGSLLCLFSVRRSKGIGFFLATQIVVFQTTRWYGRFVLFVNTLIRVERYAFVL